VFSACRANHFEGVWHVSRDRRHIAIARIGVDRDVSLCQPTLIDEIEELTL
jgi:hypothetical protein